MFDDENENLAAYLAEDPSILTEEELRDIAKVFGLTFDTVQNIAKGMTHARNQVREQYASPDH